MRFLRSGHDQVYRDYPIVEQMLTKCDMIWLFQLFRDIMDSYDGVVRVKINSISYR